MNKQEQDKLWNDLSREKQLIIKQLYKGYSQGDLSAEKCFETIFGEHNLKPSLTYEDVAIALYEEKTGYVFDEHDLIKEFNFGNCGLPLPLNCTTKRQAEKICAINKLLNVAKFLNKNEDGSDWVPDWKDCEYYPSESKWYFLICDGEILIKRDDISCSALVYFRTRELAGQAIQILGEDVIRTALITEY